MGKVKVSPTLIKAQALASKGQKDEARALYESVLEAFPANERARKGLKKLIEGHVKPGQVDPPQETLDTLNQLHFSGLYEVLDSRLGPLLERFPSSATLWNLRGVSRAGLEHWQEAMLAFRRVIELAPEYAGGHNNLGNALHALGDDEAAAKCYARAVMLKPMDASYHVNYANALVCLRRVEEAMHNFRRALDLQPENAEAWDGLGVYAYETADMETAENFFRQAATLNPTSANFSINHGLSLLRLNRLEEANTVLDRADGLRPMTADQHGKFGEAMEVLRRRPDAIRHQRLALEIDPTKENIRAHLYHQQMQIGDWGDYKSMQEHTVSLGMGSEAVDPWGMLALEDAPARQLIRSKKYALSRMKKTVSYAPAPAQPRATSKLRVGYFIGDPFGHATMHLMAGLFRNHDRSAFDITLFGYPRASLAPHRDNFLRPEDTLHDIRLMSRGEAVDLARSADLDVAIDLKGYTMDSRFDDLAERVAPIQIHHLAYPGSLGAECFDYIVADHVLVPPEWRHCYSESIIYMPHTYQSNDDARLISACTTTRADFGLPDEAFVMCCFNQSYKITPSEFDIWMRLMTRIPGSVLWLLRANPWCQDNLRREAEARGVEGERLIFAQQLSQSQHLARIAHADVFVDTFNCNAHTTASDALWAGLPVVTKIGKQFAARVAASLLTAIGAPELITRTEQEYEALILKLASEPQFLASFRARLSENRLVAPLFDTRRYTADFEAGLKAVVERHAKGLPPADISVPG